MKMKCLEVFHAIHKCIYPKCIGQAATSWVLSQHSVNLLVSLMSGGLPKTFYEINNELDSLSSYKTKIGVFHSPFWKEEDKFKKVKGLYKKQINFKQDPSATSKISEWIDHVANFEEFNLKNSLPHAITFALVNVCSYEGVWKDASSKGRFMKIHNSFTYTQDVNYEARIMELPMKDNDFRLLVVTPNEVDQLHTLFRRLTNDGLKASFDSLRPLFTIDAIFNPPDVDVSSQVHVRLEKESINEVIQYGTVRISESGTQIKILSCLYSSDKNLNEVDTRLEKEKAPYFFAVTFKDTPIFTGQYIPTYLY